MFPPRHQSQQMNLNQNESFSDTDLGLGMLDGSNNDLDNLSDVLSQASSNENDLGGKQQFNQGIEDREEDFDIQSNMSGSNNSVSSYAGSDLTPEEEQKKKVILLAKLKRLQKRGYQLSRPFNLDSSLEDIQAEVDSIKREANLEQGTKVAKNTLISICSILEYTNNRFDPLDIVLDGWSEEINEDVENGEYDEVMEELYDKYYDKVQMTPEMKLLMMVGGSAIKFHLSHTLLKSMIPGADTLLKQNPNLKNEIASLVNKTEQGKAFQDQLNNLHTGEVTGLGKSTQDMVGPTDVDDILAELENETNNNMSSNKIMNDGVMDITF